MKKKTRWFVHIDTNGSKLSQELCECLREELSVFEKKTVPSKESIKDMERIVRTLEQEKVCVETIFNCFFQHFSLL